MAKSPNAVYLRVTASYTLGFLMTKCPGLMFRMKHKISKEIFFDILIYGKMIIIQFNCMEEILSYYFMFWKKGLSCYYHSIFLVYEIV